MKKLTKRSIKKIRTSNPGVDLDLLEQSIGDEILLQIGRYARFPGKFTFNSQKNLYFVIDNRQAVAIFPIEAIVGIRKMTLDERFQVATHLDIELTISSP